MYIYCILNYIIGSSSYTMSKLSSENRLNDYIYIYYLKSFNAVRECTKIRETENLMRPRDNYYVILGHTRVLE